MITYKFWDETESVVIGDKRICHGIIYETLANISSSELKDMSNFPPFSKNWIESSDSLYLTIEETETSMHIYALTVIDDITITLPNIQKGINEINFVKIDSDNTLTVDTYASVTINSSVNSVEYTTAADNVTFTSSSNTNWNVSSEVADKPPIVFSARNSVEQTFTNTRIDVTLDTEIQSFGDLAHLDSGNIVFDKGGVFILMVSVGIGVSSGSSRSIGEGYVQINRGSGFVDIPDIKLLTYNRTANTGTAGDSAQIPINVNAGDILKIQTVRANGSDTLKTIFPSCSMTIISSKGLRGEKGNKGDRGADGDITWAGTWSAGTYDTNQGVQYQGSAFVCTADGNTNNPGTPSSPNVGWDLWVEKGADGAGATINIQDTGSNVPNTPHGTINFTGNLTATDAGSGVVNVDIVIPKNSYMVPVWAEENGGLSPDPNNNGYEWAYGNGANTPNDGGVTIFVPSGYICQVIAMSLRIGGGTATVDLVHNGTIQGSDCNITISTGQGASADASSPVNVLDGDYINFKTSAASGTSGPCVVTAWLKYTEI